MLVRFMREKGEHNALTWLADVDGDKVQTGLECDAPLTESLVKLAEWFACAVTFSGDVEVAGITVYLRPIAPDGPPPPAPAAVAVK